MIVYTISSDDMVDFSLLKIWGKKSGGDSFNLNKESSSDIVQRIPEITGKSSFSFLSYTLENVNEVFPSVPQTIHGSRWSLAGKIIDPTKPASIVIHYGFGSLVSKTTTYKLSDIKEEPGHCVARFWGKIYISFFFKH